MKDKAQVGDTFGASLTAQGVLEEKQTLEGHYRFELTDSEGNTLWIEDVKNLITTVGKGQLWTTGFIGTTVYMGLISSASFSAVAAADTMTSHAGWLEAGLAHAPTYTAPRPTETFSATTNGTIVSAAALAFVFTGSGTVEGGFLNGGTGATNTIDNTGGVLLSAGTLAVAQPVISGNTLNVSYSGTLT